MKFWLKLCPSHSVLHGAFYACFHRLSQGKLWVKNVKVRQKCDIVPGKGSPGISRCLRGGPKFSDVFYRILQISLIFPHFSSGIPLLKGPFVGHFGHFWTTFVTWFPCWRVRSLPTLIIFFAVSSWNSLVEGSAHWSFGASRWNSRA